ncbi:MAG TPA: M4 family metallopeptidase [Edaphocola sp.]|nr:M4 family metallopeptidase [Edaphocola sp.]
MKLKFIPLFLLAIGAYNVSNAQDNYKIAHQEDGSVFVSFRNQKVNTQIDGKVLSQWLGLQNENELRLVRTNIDHLGISHALYQQYYKNIEVDGANIMVHSKGNELLSINGKIYDISYVNTNAVLDDYRATTLSQTALGIVSVLRNYAPIKSIINHNGSPVLGYVVRMDGKAQDGSFIMKKAIISAMDGSVLDIEELIANAEVNISGRTLFHGDKTISADFDGSKYRLFDSTRNIHTLDATNAEYNNWGSGLAFPDAKEYYSNTDNWGVDTAIMNVILNTTTSNILNGTGWNTMTFPISAVADNSVDTNIDISSWPVVFTNSTSTPLRGRGFYHFVKPGVDYYGVFGKYNLTNENVSDTIIFPIVTDSLGNFSWSDTSGNSGIYKIDTVANPAIDAHWGIIETHDYYVDKFNLKSYDGNGSIIRNYVNGVFPVSFTQTNAAALPAPYNAMVYGLGDGLNMKPFVALDVTGHEYTHMVIANNGNGGLRYKGESGALNESFADMFGKSIEFYATPTTANWLIGTDVFNGAGYLRSMPNPKLVQNPDTYKGQYWVNTSSNTDNGGVHYNSGVPNKWYYLITEGGTGTNDNGYQYSVTGIGMAKAEQIAYRTMSQYLTYQATFQNAYTGSLQACLDLYGNDTTSAEYTAVKNAWYAVGLGEGGPTTIKNIDNENKIINVYPNPSTGNQFSIRSNADQKIEVVIYNNMGKEMKRMFVENGDNTIVINEWSSGIYNISYKYNGKQYFQKLSIIK